MLRIYKSEDGGKLVKLKKNRVTPLSWYNMINPSVDEMEKVSEQLKLDPDMLKNALDLDERSRVEFDDGVLSLIINLPWMDDDGKFDTLPCGLFFTKNNFTEWFKENIEKLNIVSTYNLIYNASVMVEEKIGYAIGLDKLLNNKNLCFRAFYPKLESELDVVWKKNQILSPAGKIFLNTLMKKINN